MNYDHFYKKATAELNLSDEQVKDFIDVVELVAQHNGYNFNDLDLISRLFKNKDGISANSTYFNRRSRIVVLFYETLLADGIVSEETLAHVRQLKFSDLDLEEMLRQYYFKDLDGVLDYISNVGALYGQNDDSNLLLYKAIMILAWHEIQTSDALNIKKSDITLDPCGVMVDEEFIPIERKYVDILIRLADMEIYTPFPANKQMFYADSPYLIRSCRKAQLELTDVKCLFARFNQKAKEVGEDTVLSTKHMLNNGRYYRVAIDGRNKTFNVKYRDASRWHSDRPHARKIYTVYTQWYKMFIGDIME